MRSKVDDERVHEEKRVKAQQEALNTKKINLEFHDKRSSFMKEVTSQERVADKAWIDQIASALKEEELNKSAGKKKHVGALNSMLAM